MKKILIILMVLVFGSLSAQEYDNEDEGTNESIVNFSGNLLVTSSLYSNGGVGSQRESPYSYAITGSPVLTIYKLSIPMTFSYADQKFNYSYSFSTYGASPRYKWAQLHLGYRSMNFSSFTLDGRQFLGSGIELRPGKFYFGALYGRLDNRFARKYKIGIEVSDIETYKRSMYGFKIGYGENSRIDFVALKVKDDPASSEPKEGDNTELVPKDNVVLGLNFNTDLFDKLSVRMESAASLMTNDARSTVEVDSTDEYYSLYSRVNKIIKTNISTRWGYIFSMNSRLRLNLFNIGFTYKRVTSDFNSLGVYYILTDFEDYTANLSFSLFKRQVHFNLRGGFNRNNLSLVRRATNLRRIGSIQANYASSNGFNISFNYSNIQSDQKAGYMELDDTLRLVLVNQNLAVNSGYNWGNKNISHSVNLNFNASSMTNINDKYFMPVGESDNKNINLSYNLRHKPTNMRYKCSFNYFVLNSDDYTSTGLGVDLGANRKLLKDKLTVGLNTSFTQRTANGENDGLHFKLRNNIGYNITKNQKLNFYFSWSKRPSISKRPLNEMRANFTYNLNF